MRFPATFLAASAMIAAGATISVAADPNRPYVAPPPDYDQAAAACWAVLHADNDGAGPSLVRRGPEAIPVIRRLTYENGVTLNGRVRSVTTGPGARVILFNGRNFKVPMLEVGPESVVNLARPVADSYRIDCVVPTPPISPLQ